MYSYSGRKASRAWWIFYVMSSVTDAFKKNLGREGEIWWMCFIRIIESKEVNKGKTYLNCGSWPMHIKISDSLKNMWQKYFEKKMFLC